MSMLIVAITSAKGAMEGGSGGGVAWVCWSTAIGVTVSGVPCRVSTGRTLLPCVGAWVPTLATEAKGRMEGGEKG